MTSEQTSSSKAIRPIAPGVFFKSIESLPRGRHSLTAEQVLEAQRERLLVTVTELLAANGYRGFGMADIASRAGVSLGAFYECFDGKDECIFAGYDRFIQVLLGRMIAVNGPEIDPVATVMDLIHAYLDTLQEDFVVARAYQVEIDSLGSPARHRRRYALTRFASLIRERAIRLSGTDQPAAEIPWTLYLGVVYAVRQLVSDALDDSPEPDLSTLATDLAGWITDVFRLR